MSLKDFVTVARAFQLMRALFAEECTLSVEFLALLHDSN
ncbi:protein of unknown function [Candidatus Nitrosocaldus cavascurensis]|uniref:Uncharacterized protein n=1 Tax=Candidatus Nitrosocaldus cavascurensis TaxID=2058097 RepID=A0A2K5ASM6_9ARCH|nr:protein of unknown function [Candidatus Nitrosocaldus cavascurensis]